MQVNVQTLLSVIRSVRGTGVDELDYSSHESERIFLVRKAGTSAHGGRLEGSSGSTVRLPGVSSGLHAAQSSDGKGSVSEVVRATMYGTFYAAQAPDKPPFVVLGQSVNAGDQVGVIEAMKMLHGIETDHGGRVLEVLVENGAIVEAGAALFRIEKESGSV